MLSLRDPFWASEPKTVSLEVSPKRVVEFDLNVASLIQGLSVSIPIPAAQLQLAEFNNSTVKRAGGFRGSYGESRTGVLAVMLSS